MTTTTDHTTVFTRPTGDDAFELPPTRGVGTTTTAPRRRHVARETHPYSDTPMSSTARSPAPPTTPTPTTVAGDTSWHVATDHRHELTNHGPCDAVVVTLVGV